ncbi:MAG: hypothetical protein J6I79_02940 [Paludibacteraceae bacterium]|nr:hypothetical protein [Paludibacteraceae bacterium]
MSREKNLMQIINACEKHEFDKIVKAYLKEVYNYERIVQTDGKDDCGIDLRVFDCSGQKIQYQMTIQKSGTTTEKSALKKKLFEDVDKALNNVTNNGFSDSLYFFYSHEMTNKLKFEYKREAKQKGISLEIIDATQIAQESEDYLGLQEVIYETSGLNEFKLKRSLFEDKNTCLIYDLVSFGVSSDIKMEIVEAYIFQCLYESNGLTQEQISNKCKEKFQSKENPTFYAKLINKLYSTEKKINYSKETKLYFLESRERDSYRKRLEQMQLDEKTFLSLIGEELRKNGQESYLDEYVSYLHNAYISIFSKRVEAHSAPEYTDKDLEAILNFANDQLQDKDKAKSLVSRLITICDSNKYLQKISASKVFSSRVNVDNLQKYANEKKRVFIDTTIGINLICYFYDTHSKYGNYNYILSKSLKEFCAENGIKLYLSERYLWEITSHVRDAFNILPFTKIEGLNILGGSRNVFFNFYRFIVDNKDYEGTFDEFLSEMDFLTSDSSDSINQKIQYYLEEMGVEIEHFENLYDIQETRRLMETILAESDRFKTSFALENDCIMLKFLADSNVDVHKVDPVFITWDKTLFKILKDFYQVNMNANRWMQFTPSQFIDRYSLLSFSIGSETISKEMLAVLSDDIVQHTNNLLDSLSLILNPSEEAGLKYTKKMMEMKNTQIYTIDKKSDEPVSSEDNALDRVIYYITNHYQDRINSLRKVFATEDYMDEVVNLIKEGVKSYRDSKKLNDTLFERIDQIIKSIK